MNNNFAPRLKIGHAYKVCGPIPEQNKIVKLVGPHPDDGAGLVICWWDEDKDEQAFRICEASDLGCEVPEERGVALPKTGEEQPSIGQRRFELFVRTINAVTNDDDLTPQEAEFDRLMRENVIDKSSLPDTADELLALITAQIDRALAVK